MEKTIQITPTLTNKQKQALRLLTTPNNGITEILYGGGAGSGKSALGCIWLISMCNKYPETNWLIGRSKLSTLKETTLKCFFDVCKRFGLKAGEHFVYNQQSHTIKFLASQSQILLKDLFAYPSDPDWDSLGSLEITGAFIDECTQISEKAKNMVQSRIRYKLDEYNLEPKLLLTCNPAKGWVYDQFYKKKKDGNIEFYKEFIPALVGDNQFISKHYVTNLGRLDDISKKRLFYGEWEYADSLSLFNYDSLLDMFDLPELNNDEQIANQKKECLLSIDVAHLGKDKTVVLVWQDLTIIEVDFMEKCTFPEQQARIQAIQYKHHITNSNIVMDLDGLSAGLYDLFPGCTGIHNNGKTVNGEDFQNLKTQLYYKLAELVNSNQIKIHCDSDTQTKITQELQIIKREKVDLDGKIMMTNKEQSKRMLGRSPDYADAMAFRMYWVLKSQEFDYSFYVV